MASILIIDDDDSSRTLLRQILETAGHEVVEAEDGAQGIARYRRQPTDLLIVDIMMPVKDGMTVINDITRDDPQAKIIVVTGGGQRGQTEFFCDASRILGAKRTFLKPIDPVEMLAAVAELVSSR